MAKKKSLPFEASLQSLETLVEQMEKGDMTLEDSLKSFEQGIQLTRNCQTLLQQAEQTVQILLEENGTATLKPLNDDDES